MLQFDLKAFEPRSFALTLAPAPVCGQLKHSMPIELPYDTDLLSFNRNRADCDTACPVALPAERFPSEIRCGGVRFVTGPKEDLAANAVICRGQKLSIPEGAKYLSLMMASLSGDRRTALTIGKTGFLFTVHDLLEAVGNGISTACRRLGRLSRPFLPGMRLISIEAMRIATASRRIFQIYVRNSRGSEILYPPARSKPPSSGCKRHRSSRLPDSRAAV